MDKTSAMRFVHCEDYEENKSKKHAKLKKSKNILEMGKYFRHCRYCGQAYTKILIFCNRERI